MPVGQVQQQGVARGPLHHRADRRAAELAHDQVALPVTRYGPVGDLDRAFADHHHVRDPTTSLLGAVGATGSTTDPPGPQTLGQVSAQYATGLDVERLID